MGHELAEKTAGLASRVNNLAFLETGLPSRKLLEEQDRLAKLALVAIVKDLNEEDSAYKAALIGLNQAIEYIGNADKQIGDVAKAIQLTAEAADLVEQAIKLAAL